MKKFLFFTIAFLLMPLIALAKGEDEVASYQIEGAGTGAQGTYLVKVWVVTDNKKLSDDIIGRCGVHGVLFKGFSNTETPRLLQRILCRRRRISQLRTGCKQHSHSC